MKKTLLFDLDGTLINSQPIINTFLLRRLQEKNIILEESEKKILNGISVQDFVIWLQKKKHAKITEEEVSIDDTIISQIKLFSGIQELLSRLQKKNYTMALVTNSPRSYTQKILEQLDMERFFTVIITEDDAKIAKPDPTMLIMAAKQLNVKYKDCIMIDDNAPGIEAGNLLKMTTIRIGLKQEKANYCIKTCAELEKILKKIKK